MASLGFFSLAYALYPEGISLCICLYCLGNGDRCFDLGWSGHLQQVHVCLNCWCRCLIDVGIGFIFKDQALCLVFESSGGFCFCI